ncbi:MAG: 5'/3'-nucleotidase SurE [Bacteroidales bacterium]
MGEAHRPMILVTNDDGVHAPGIKFLASVASEFGDVIVIAPAGGMSGMGHAITIKTPLRCHELVPNGVQRQFAVEGTPVDCVKLAIRKLLKRKPDLLLSGVNHGSNASVNIIYSGTMAAAFEGAMAGIPSVGFSLLDYSHNAPLEHLRPFLRQVIQNTLDHGLPPNVCLNVNMPPFKPEEPIKGIRLCRQAVGHWKEDFEERVDPHHQPYFWLHGEFVRQDYGEDTDLSALEQHWISLVPVHFDFTAFHAMDTLQRWNGVTPSMINSGGYEIL